MIGDVFLVLTFDHRPYIDAYGLPYLIPYHFPYLLQEVIFTFVNLVCSQKPNGVEAHGNFGLSRSEYDMCTQGGDSFIDDAIGHAEQHRQLTHFCRIRIEPDIFGACQFHFIQLVSQSVDWTVVRFVL